MNSQTIKLIALLLLGGSFCAADDRPNVIVVLSDDQGYADFSCHGNPVLKTPNLDKLHAQSIRFIDFHVSPVCTPTRGQLLTGRDAMHNGAWSRESGHEMIHDGNTTMADIFKANGYATGHFGKWHLGDNYPFRPGDKGFDESVTFGGAAVHQTPDYWQNDNMDDFYRHKDGVWRQHKGYCTDVWFDLSIDFMKRCQDKERPFFVYLPTNAPHTPTYVEQKFSSQYTGRAAKFFGMIANLDENMGRLDSYLTESGLAPNTILIYMTDNGGALGLKTYDAGLRGRKKDYFDGGHRAACFVRWPTGNLGRPRDIDELTQVQDILPTLIDLVHLESDKETSEKLDGKSLAGLMTGRQSKLLDRKLVVQWSELDYPKRGHAAVMWKKWRLVHNTHLYNLADDPSQTNDVAAEHPEVVKAMQQHYAAWWKTVEPVVGIHSRPIIGALENPSRLTCFEWTKKTGKATPIPQRNVWAGANMNGSWLLTVATPGKYRFELRRYPKEADFPITEAYPQTKRELVNFKECRALPVARARIRICDFEETTDVSANNEYVSFEVKLPQGEIELKTWLLDKNGNELCGAYYVQATRL